MPPFVIYPGHNITGSIDTSGFPDSFVWVQPAGWMDGKGFLQFLQCMDGYLSVKKTQRPVILFVDNHSSHK